MIGDEDDNALGAGTEGQGTEGQDDGNGGHEPQADLSAEHAEPEADDGEQEEVTAPSRGQGRIQRLANETRDAKERAERAERRLQEIERQQWQQNSARSEQEERERLALMTPDERADYKIEKFQREQAQQRQQDQIRQATAMDKVAYDAKATINPVYARHQDEVERRFQEQLQAGRPVEREVILKLLLGERALAGAVGGNGSARRQGRQRVESQRVASGSGKGDAASERGKAGDTPESRLRDVYI